MRSRFLLGTALVLAILLLSQSSSFSWGENADRLVANKAVDTLPEEMQPFFQANRQFLVQHITNLQEAVPKSVIPFEHPRPADFVELDHYGPFPFSALPRDYKNAMSKFNRRTLDEYGVLPWQVGLYSKKLTDAFHDHDWNEAKLSAALLAHYVTAAHDPFQDKLVLTTGLEQGWWIAISYFSFSSQAKLCSFTTPRTARLRCA